MKCDLILDLTAGHDENQHEYVHEHTHVDFTEKNIKLVGVIEHLSIKRTKTGKDMAFLTLEDLTGSIEVIVFPTVFSRCTNELSRENIIVVEGKVTQEDEKFRVIANEIRSFPVDLTFLKLYLKIDKKDEVNMDELKKTLRFFSGETPVYVYFAEEKRTALASKDMWVSENKVLLDKLGILLKPENVKLVCE
jgi:DNA polymerase-3 subunit alpha